MIDTDKEKLRALPMMWCLMWRLTATQQRVDHSDLETMKCRIFGVASISKLYHARRLFPIDISIIHSFLQHNYEEKTTSEILRDHAMQQCVIVSWLRKLISPLTAATRRDDTGDDDERWRDDCGDHVHRSSVCLFNGEIKCWILQLLWTKFSLISLNFTSGNLFNFIVLLSCDLK